MANTCKYLKMQKFVSYNSGATWQPLNEYKKGMLYESDSIDCGGGNLQYRWYPSGTTCVGYDLYNRSIRQYSNDGGESWTNVSPAEYTATTLIEANSEDCGYVPPTNFKFKATYNNSTTYSAECNSSSTLTSGETKPSGYDFSAMTSAVIGDCVTVIGINAFRICSGLTSVTIPNSVTSIGSSAFLACTSLTSVTIPRSVTSIGGESFASCGFTSLFIPNSVTTFGWGPFNRCKSLSSITIENGITTIVDGCFQECSSLPNITIPSSVTSIGSHAFYMCSGLTSIDIPNSVTSIGGSAFQRCSVLTNATIGSGVTYIGCAAFNECTSLTSVTIRATTPPSLPLCTPKAFDDTNNCPIYVPAGSVNTYKFASGWSTYADRIQAIP